MKIFVTGATGVLGRRTVALLRASGADVTGVARTRAKGDELRALGVTPVEVSLFDRDALSAAVAGHQVVVNLATAVPTGERASRRSVDWCRSGSSAVTWSVRESFRYVSDTSLFRIF